MGVFVTPSIHVKIAWSIRHIMTVPTMIQTEKNSSGNVVKYACRLLNFAPPLFVPEKEASSKSRDYSIKVLRSQICTS